MADAYQPNHLDKESSAARGTVLQANFPDASSPTADGSLLPIDVHSYGQASPARRVSSYSRLPPHGQMSPEASLNLPPISYTMADDQASGGPTAGVYPFSYMVPGDRTPYPMMAPHHGLQTPHQDSASSGAYSFVTSRQFDSSPTGNSSAPNYSHFPGAQSPQNYAPYLASPMASQRSLSSPYPMLRQTGLGQDRRPVHVANPMASLKDVKSTRVTRRNTGPENSIVGGPKPLPVMALGLRRSVGVPDEDGNSSTSSLSPISIISDSEDSDQEMDDEDGERAVTTQSEIGMDTMDIYAFNFAREAYEHRVPQKLTTGITIYVDNLAAMTTSLKQHQQEMKQKTSAAHKDVIPPPLPHPNEFQKRPLQRSIECVWIGMVPSAAALAQLQSKLNQPESGAAGEEGQKKAARKRAKKSHTVSNLSEDELHIIGFDRNALRVVAKKSNKTTKDTHIYALLNPSTVSKLCQGFKVNFDDVFYFRKFRNDIAKSIMPRKQATIAKIRAMVFPVVAPAAPQSPGPLVVYATKNDSSRSKSTSTKPLMNEEQDKSRKRKLQHDIVNAIMKHRDEKRKKARAEGYSVPLSDSELSESKENSESGEIGEDGDQDAPAGRVEDSDGNLIDPVSDYSADVEEPTEPASLSANKMRMGINLEEHVDEEAYPEHTVSAEDLSHINFKERQIMRLDRIAKLQVKAVKTVSFQHPTGQVIDKNGSVVNHISPRIQDRDGETKDLNCGSVEWDSSSLVEKITQLANELAISEDIIGLQQALTMVKCVKDRRGPPKTSALGVYFNIPNSKDILIEDCAKQLKQLRALFQGLEGDNDIQDHVLAWMIKGLQMTGQSLSIDLLQPCLSAFAALYRAKFGNASASRPDRMSRNVLVDMICVARDDAEEMLRCAATRSRGADRDHDLQTEGECPSHPYFDPAEEVVYQPVVWERPEDRSSGPD